MKKIDWDELRKWLPSKKESLVFLVVTLVFLSVFIGHGIDNYLRGQVVDGPPNYSGFIDMNNSYIKRGDWGQDKLHVQLDTGEAFIVEAGWALFVDYDVENMFEEDHYYSFWMYNDELVLVHDWGQLRDNVTMSIRVWNVAPEIMDVVMSRNLDDNTIWFTLVVTDVPLDMVSGHVMGDNISHSLPIRYTGDDIIRFVSFAESGRENRLTIILRDEAGGVSITEVNIYADSCSFKEVYRLDDPYQEIEVT